MNILRKLDAFRTGKFNRLISTGIKNTQQVQTQYVEEVSKRQNVKHRQASEEKELQQNEREKPFTDYRFSHPEFLPDPDPVYRQPLREKLEHIDMMARRSQILIPEFYVGSILAVVYSDPHTPTKTNRFVGICIERKGCGLRACFTLRNVVDGQGVEVRYDIYDPTIQSIECLRLEKRLDDHLLYLRDAPATYSTVPFEMEPVKLYEGEPIPINPIRVPLNPPPWYAKWEREDLKGVQDLMPLLSQNRRNKVNVGRKPWEKYDLMKQYRASIPQEEQVDIFRDIADKLDIMEKEVRNKRKIVK